MYAMDGKTKLIETCIDVAKECRTEEQITSARQYIKSVIKITPITLGTAYWFGYATGIVDCRAEMIKP